MKCYFPQNVPKFKQGLHVKISYTDCCSGLISRPMLAPAVNWPYLLFNF